MAATWELNPKVTFDSLRQEFIRNPVLAWMNYGSVLLRSQGVLKALRDPMLMERHVSKYRRHPWDPVVEAFVSTFRGVPGRKYFVHIDLSKNRDATGVAMVHREPGTNLWVTDFMLFLQPAQGKEIDIAAVRKTFVVDLRDKRGFDICGVSYDGWQSEESLQTLTKLGFAASYVSVDRTKAPYDTLIGLISEGKLDYYDYPPFLQQMRELELVRGLKYDHPRKSADGSPGRKDVSDAVAAATFNGLAYERDNPEAAPELFVHSNPQYAKRDRYNERSIF